MCNRMETLLRVFVLSFCFFAGWFIGTHYESRISRFETAVSQFSVSADQRISELENFAKEINKIIQNSQKQAPVKK